MLIARLPAKAKAPGFSLWLNNEGIPLGVSGGQRPAWVRRRWCQQTLDLFNPETVPPRLVGDEAYDSDALDDALAELGIEMIAPEIEKTGLRKTKLKTGAPWGDTVTAGSLKEPSRSLRQSSPLVSSLGKEAVGFHGLHAAWLSYDRHASLKSDSIRSCPFRNLLFGQPLAR